MRRLDGYRGKLDRLRRGARLTSTVKIEYKDKTVSVSTIYLNSGYVLNSQVEWLIRNTPDHHWIGTYYTPKDFKGKTSNDVFALIDLAGRSSSPTGTVS